MHYDWDDTGYPMFYVHGLSGEHKRDRASLDAMLLQFEAASELLAACRELVAAGEYAVSSESELKIMLRLGAATDAARAAIAKAEGRA